MILLRLRGDKGSEVAKGVFLLKWKICSVILWGMTGGKLNYRLVLESNHIMWYLNGLNMFYLHSSYWVVIQNEHFYLSRDIKNRNICDIILHQHGIFFTLFSEQIFSDFLHWRLFCNFLTCEVMCRYPFFSPCLVPGNWIEPNKNSTGKSSFFPRFPFHKWTKKTVIQFQTLNLFYSWNEI